jgi:hypothetical protein
MPEGGGREAERGLEETEAETAAMMLKSGTIFRAAES